MKQHNNFLFSFCRYASVVLFAVIAFSSCHKNEAANPADFGYTYFPDQEGTYVIYDVDSIHHNDFTGKVDTFKFQLKEYVDSVFPDNENRPTLRIERYKREYNPAIPYDKLPWKLKDIWTANRTGSTAEKVEENIRFVKLVFPLYKNRKWNGNAFNILGIQEYECTEINIPRTIAKQAFDSTAFISQINKENLIEKKYYVEVFAKNTGLVYKQIIDVYSSTVNPAIPLMERITKGIQFTMTVNSFGKE